MNSNDFSSSTATMKINFKFDLVHVSTVDVWFYALRWKINAHPHLQTDRKTDRQTAKRVRFVFSWTFKWQLNSYQIVDYTLNSVIKKIVWFCGRFRNFSSNFRCHSVPKRSNEEFFFFFVGNRLKRKIGKGNTHSFSMKSHPIENSFNRNSLDLKHILFIRFQGIPFITIETKLLLLLLLLLQQKSNSR